MNPANVPRRSGATPELGVGREAADVGLVDHGVRDVWPSGASPSQS